MITLEDDDADAVEEVLRKIYGCTLPAAKTKEWRFWFNLVTTADKYLEPDLSSKADQHLRDVALQVQDADVVFDIIQAIKSDMSHLPSLLAFAEVLRKNNLKNLLKNERYRNLLIGNKDLMLAQLDEHVESIEDRKELVEKEYFLCPNHEAEVFQTPKGPMHSEFCSRCPSRNAFLRRVGRTAFLPKY